MLLESLTIPLTFIIYQIHNEREGYPLTKLQVIYMKDDNTSDNKALTSIHLYNRHLKNYVFIDYSHLNKLKVCSNLFIFIF